MSSRMKDMIMTLLLVVAPAGWNTVTADTSAIIKVRTGPSKRVVLGRNAGKPVKPNAIQRHISPPLKGHDFTKIPSGARYKPGVLFVRFAPRADGTQRSIAEKERIIRRLGGRILRHYRIVQGLVLVALPPGQTVMDALIIYNRVREILYAEPVYITHIPDQPEPKPVPRRIPSGRRIGLRSQSQRLRPQHSNRTRKTILRLR